MNVHLKMLFAVAVLTAGGCKKKEDSAGTASAPATPAATGSAEPAAATPTPPSAPGGNEACKLLEGDKLGELVGAKFGGATPATVQGETSACFWSEEADGGRSLSITYYRGNTGKEAWKNMAAVGGETAVAGVGDEAFVNEKIATMRVRKGDNVASLSWRGEVTPDQQKAVAIEVATRM